MGNNIFGIAAIKGVRLAAVIEFAAIARCTAERERVPAAARQHLDRRIESVLARLCPRGGDRDVDAQSAQRRCQLAHVDRSALVPE